MALTKEDKKDVAEIVAQVVSGIMDAQRSQPAQLAPDATDPRSPLYQLRKGGPPHDVRQVSGVLALVDGSHGNFRGSGKVLATVPAEVEADFTKHPSGFVTNVVCAFDPAIPFYEQEFRTAKAEAYRQSEGDAEQLNHLAKELDRYIRVNLYHRCRLGTLDLVGNTLDSEDVKLVFRQGASAPPAVSVPAAAE